MTFASTTDVDDVLRREFEATDESFLLQLRGDLRWDMKAFRRLTDAMLAFARAHESDDALPRWAAEGFWYVSWFVKSWSEHPSFPRPHPPAYYEAAYERLNDLAYWMFVGACMYTDAEPLECLLPGEELNDA